MLGSFDENTEMNLSPDGSHAELDRVEQDSSEQRVLARLQEGQATKAQLKKALGTALARTLDAVLSGMLSEARIFAHYKPLQSGLPSKTLIGYSLEAPMAPAPSAWVSSVAHEFEQAAARAAAFGLTPETLFAETVRTLNLDPEAVLLAVLEQEHLDVRALLLSTARKLGVSLGRTSLRAPARHSVPPASRKTDTEIVLQVFSELCRLAPAQSALPIARLRTATHLDRPRFDRAALVLASFGSIELVPHARAEAPTKQELAELLIDQRGSQFSHVVAKLPR